MAAREARKSRGKNRQMVLHIDYMNPMGSSLDYCEIDEGDGRADASECDTVAIDTSNSERASHSDVCAAECGKLDYLIIDSTQFNGNIGDPYDSPSPLSPSRSSVSAADIKQRTSSGGNLMSPAELVSCWDSTYDVESPRRRRSSFCCRQDRVPSPKISPIPPLYNWDYEEMAPIAVTWDCRGLSRTRIRHYLEALVTNGDVGEFIVRDRSTEPGTLALQYKTGHNCYRTVVIDTACDSDDKSVYFLRGPSNAPRFPSVETFIQWHLQEPRPVLGHIQLVDTTPQISGRSKQRHRASMMMPLVNSSSKLKGCQRARLEPGLINQVDKSRQCGSMESVSLKQSVAEKPID